MVYTFDLKDKVVVITGGYGHLGKAISKSLAFHGATVVVFGRNEEKFRSAFNDSDEKKKIHFVSCDILETASIVKAFAEVITQFGRINVLINNAVSSKGQSPETMTDDQWWYGVDGTLNSVFRCIREALPHLKSSKGKIINVSSMYGMVAPDFEIYNDHPEFLNPPHYGAAKAGVIQLTKYYASYLGNHGITVNAVTPGPFPSKHVQMTTGFIKALAEKTLLKRIGQPEDLAGAFVFLASDASNYITGQNIVIDGGWTAK
jgi:NAD(P)-dependent dehydrogenase (short-subunit alcohol dehydrogenase family)